MDKVADVCVDDSKCLGCENCGYACAEFHGKGENRRYWIIHMVNGVATIKDVEFCRANQEKCGQICLQNCPTKALSAQLKPIKKQKK